MQDQTSGYQKVYILLIIFVPSLFLATLANGNPPVFVRTLAGTGEIGIDPMNLDDKSLKLSAQRIREVLLDKSVDL